MLVGLDEVGRGSWAGPLVVAAVAGNNLPNNLNDSKKLTFSQRQKLDVQIRESTNYISIIQISNKLLDSIGLTKSISLAMHRAVKGLGLVKSDHIIVDGNYNFLADLANSSTLIKADTKIKEVMAASIVAKVFRDNLMIEYGKEYPAYSFETNFGYGTLAHNQSIIKNGICPLHRLSFRPMKDIILK